MALLDRPLRQVAKTLTGKLGKQGTLTYVTTGDYNPSTGTASQTDETVTTRGALTTYTESEIDGSTVKRGDLKWSVAAKDLSRPHVNDIVDFGETTPEGKPVRYTVMDVGLVHSGDEPALYVLQLRR